MWLSVNLKLPKATQRNLSWEKKQGYIWYVCAFVCMCVLPVCTTYVWCGFSRRSEDSIRSLGAVQCQCWEPKSGSLQEHFVLLISEHLLVLEVLEDIVFYFIRVMIKIKL